MGALMKTGLGSVALGLTILSVVALGLGCGGSRDDGDGAATSALHDPAVTIKGTVIVKGIPGWITPPPAADAGPGIFPPALNINVTVQENRVPLFGPTTTCSTMRMASTSVNTLLDAELPFTVNFPGDAVDQCEAASYTVFVSGTSGSSGGYSLQGHGVGWCGMTPTNCRVQIDVQTHPDSVPPASSADAGAE